MAKCNKKRTTYNEDALEILTKKYGYSVDYIRKCIRGDRKGIMASNIIKDYNSSVSASKKAIEKKLINPS